MFETKFSIYIYMYIILFIFDNILEIFSLSYIVEILYFHLKGLLVTFAKRRHNSVLARGIHLETSLNDHILYFYKIYGSIIIFN